jgi:hypothetical protein
MVADELDAGWTLVQVQQAAADEKKYGNQDTDGSQHLAFRAAMRQCRAAMRMTLEQAATGRARVPARPPPAPAPPDHLRRTGCQIVHRLRGQTLAADAPVPAFHFVEDDPGHTAHALTFYGDHCVGDLFDDLALLRRRKNFFDHADANEWHS